MSGVIRLLPNNFCCWFNTFFKTRSDLFFPKSWQNRQVCEKMKKVKTEQQYTHVFFFLYLCVRVCVYGVGPVG